MFLNYNIYTSNGLCDVFNINKIYVGLIKNVSRETI